MSMRVMRERFQARRFHSCPSHYFTTWFAYDTLIEYGFPPSTMSKSSATNTANRTMTSRNAMNNSNIHRDHHRQGEEAIVDKLHGVMAALRRERDDLHRKKALAQERLALFLEEQMALEKTHANARIKLEALKTSGNDDAIQEVVGLEQKVIRLSKEVRSMVG